MHLKKTYAMAATALAAAFSVVLLLIGVYIPINTLFFTAMAAYMIGYSIQKCGLRYGGIHLAAGVLLDLFLIPDKFNWILFLCLGGYIFASEVIFQKGNKIKDPKKKLRVQLICNWILFNTIYIPLLMFGRELFLTGDISAGAPVIWLAGQAGWIVYDKGYRVFFQTILVRSMSDDR